MKCSISTLLLVLCCTALFAQFRYVYPLPGSSMHNPETNIILKYAHPVSMASLEPADWLLVSGSRSGNADWKYRLASDGRTLLIHPAVPFQFDEEISVAVLPGLETTHGEQIPPMTFSFRTRKELSERARLRIEQERLTEWPRGNGHHYEAEAKKSLPWDSMASFTITTNGNAADGLIFYNSQNQYDEANSNSLLTILYNSGVPLWIRDTGINGHDFKLNNSGYFTYYDYVNALWVVLDSNLVTIDTLQCKNGYELETNGHDINWYPDNHVYLLAYNSQEMDLSQMIPGGQPDALVKGLIIQELDENRDVVFEWRSWDHLEITDAVSTVSLTTGTVDYCHGNSVERDADGNLLVSFRHLSEITKIDHETGSIIWRMGGENNQFTFINDNIEEHFSYQHDFRLTPSGTYTMLNNGNYLDPLRSSAKEYALDQENKTATLLWYYEHPDVDNQMVYGRAGGSVQRLWNGHTFIDWGNVSLFSKGLPNFTEVDSAGNITWELSFDSSLWISYRAHKYQWNPCARPTFSKMKEEIKFNKVTLSWAKANGAKQYEINYRPLGEDTWTVVIQPQSRIVLSMLDPLTTYEWRLRSVCSNVPSIVSGYTEIDTFTTMARLEPNPEPAAGIAVYPNPCGRQLNVQVSGPIPHEALLTVTSLFGETLTQRSFTEGEKWMLETEMLPAGSYLMRLLTSTENYTVMFVKE